MTSIKNIATVMMVAVLLSACQMTTNYTQKKLDATNSGKLAEAATAGVSQEKEKQTLLLMPVDIELSLLTAGGLTEPRADWTAQAEGHVMAILRERFSEGKSGLIEYKSDSADPLEEKRIQLQKLHEVVGGSIVLHKMVPGYILPTKKDKFDWSLGKEVALLKSKYDADYALFVFLRDSYVSAGRVALQVFAAAFGVGISGGTQVGFASLVDLNSGDVIWFNRLVSTSGDLRTAEAAENSINGLLENFPK